MARLYLYVVKSSPNPDRMHTCGVPESLSPTEIFFGPCKKRLRRELHDDFLSEGDDSVVPTEDIYLVGVNAANAAKIRKVIWAGMVLRVMKFAAAYDYIAAKFSDRTLPTLHVEPIRERGWLVGYRRRADFHTPDEWVTDLTGARESIGALICRRGDVLRVQPGVSMLSAFPRDACLILSNMFFADGQGIEIDHDLVALLRAEQPLKCGVDRYAIFGKRKDGSADGLTGWYLRVTNRERVDKFLKWLLPRVEALKGPGGRTTGLGMRGEPNVERKSMRGKRRGC